MKNLISFFLLMICVAYAADALAIIDLPTGELTCQHGYTVESPPPMY